VTRPMDMIGMEGDTIDLHVERETIEPGRSFSREAMEELGVQMSMWVATRVARRWDATDVPPTALKVTLIVEMSS
jgi:hypothetical protein